MNRYSLAALILASIPASCCAAGDPLQTDAAGNAVIREEIRVLNGAVRETWRLEWKAPPQPVCSPEVGYDEWGMCPCSGFIYGEEGDLDLVRKLPDTTEDRLHLTQFFMETPGNSGKATLPRWPVYYAQDRDVADRPDFPSVVHSRPPVKIMEMGDYNHDGRSTEFVLQIGAGPCGHQQQIVVGIDGQSPGLHAFGSVEHPDVPLVLENPGLWETVRKSSGDATLTQWQCGDHGSDEEVEIVVHLDAQGIHATRSTYTCPDDRKDRKLIGKEIL